jgi:hypothetical protein
MSLRLPNDLMVCFRAVTDGDEPAILAFRLAEHAEAQGITGFFAEVMPENRDMLAVFADAFDTTSVTGLDAIEIEFATAGWRTARTHLLSARSR